MSETRTNSMAAVLSVIVLVIFWLAIIFGFLGAVVIGIGILGAMGGGVVTLPFGEALAEGVSPGQLLTALIGLVVFAVGIAFVCSQLRRILTTLAAGDPFLPENAPRLMRIAIALGLIELIRNAVVFGFGAAGALGEGVSGKMSFNLALWGAVVVLLILAQVFKEGTRLREEEKMTI
ncbi:MAG: DUF2975 domain-containing protein [Pseudomonadota bacterium]